jgi:peptidoglycan/xylan/chitin deacetylase (PgdA/CDA1 family)
LGDDELRADVRQCREVLGSLLDGAPTLFCYPFGGRDSFDARVIETLEREGFACACTTTPGLNDHLTNPFALHRIGVYTGTSFPLFVFRLLGLEAASRGLYRRFNSTLAGKGVNC